MSYVTTAAALIGQDLLSALVVAALVLGPGWWLAWGAAKRLGWTLDAVAPLALAVTTAIAGVVALACRPLGWGLGAGLAVFAVLTIAACVAGYLVGRGLVRPAIEPEGLIVGGLATALAVLVGPYMGLTADTFYHLAAANSLLAHDAVAVTDPLYGTAVSVLDPTSGAWHTLLALASRATTLTPDWLWGGLTAVAAGCLVLAFHGLLRLVTGSSRAATLATAAWVLFGLYADFRPAAYPKTGSLAIVLIALCAFIELARRPSWPAAALAVLGGFAASVAHLGSAQLLYLGVASLWVWAALDLVAMKVRREPVEWRPFAALSATAAVLAVAAVAVIVPRLGALGGGSGLVDVGRANIDGSLVHWPLGFVTAELQAFMGGGVALSAVLIALVVLMAWTVFGPARKREAIGALALASLPLLTIYDPIVATVLYRYSPYVLARIGALFTFTPYVALAWSLAQAGGRGWRARAPRWLGYAAVVAALVASATPLAGTFARVGERRGNRYPVYVTRLIDQRVEWGSGLTRLREAVGDGYPVIAGDPETTYYAAGLARVASVGAPRSHSPYVVEQESGDARRADMARLLQSGTSEAERGALLEKWKAGFVLVWVTGRPVEQAAYGELARSSLLTEVFAPEGNGGLALFEVKR